MNFKLEFHTSATTSLEPYEIMARTQLELKDKKYTAKYLNDNCISFYDNPWRWRWNFEPYMLDGGEFVISDSHDNGKLLTLNYYWNYSSFLLTFLVMTIVLTFNKEYEGILFFGIFYAIVLPIDILRSKGKARELVEAIL